MYKQTIDDIVVISNEELNEQMAHAYIAHVRTNNPGRRIQEITLTFEGEDVSLEYTLSPVQFEKIRRITGYLVGDMTRWNNAKKGEEGDRVKHA